MGPAEYKAAAIADLRAAISDVRWTFALTTEAASFAAIVNAIDADETRVNRLESGDLAGLELTRWQGIAQTTLEDINAQAAYLGGSGYSFSRLWREVVVPTGQDVKEIAGDALETATPVLLIIAVIVIALVVLKVT